MATRQPTSLTTMATSTAPSTCAPWRTWYHGTLGRGAGAQGVWGLCGVWVRLSDHSLCRRAWSTACCRETPQQMGSAVSLTQACHRPTPRHRHPRRASRLAPLPALSPTMTPATPASPAPERRGAAPTQPLQPVSAWGRAQGEHGLSFAVTPPPSCRGPRTGAHGHAGLHGHAEPRDAATGQRTGERGSPTATSQLPPTATPPCHPAPAPTPRLPRTRAAHCPRHRRHLRAGQEQPAARGEPGAAQRGTAPCSWTGSSGGCATSGAMRTTNCRGVWQAGAGSAPASLWQRVVLMPLLCQLGVPHCVGGMCRAHVAPAVPPTQRPWVSWAWAAVRKRGVQAAAVT